MMNEDEIKKSLERMTKCSYYIYQINCRRVYSFGNAVASFLNEITIY